MTAKDQYKLLRKGFSIIRADEQKLKIKYKSAIAPEWHYVEDACKNKTELRRRMEELLLNNLIVED